MAANATNANMGHSCSVARLASSAFSELFVCPSSMTWAFIYRTGVAAHVRPHFSRQIFSEAKEFAKSCSLQTSSGFDRPSALNKHLNWWENKMEELRKPISKILTKKLKYTNLLGLDISLRNGSLKAGSLNEELLAVKKLFPRELLLCRVGEFYEAIGFDACILVEYASLNPMSGMRSDTIPKAGCPVMNLRQTLDALTSSGFSVCVYEEVKGPSQARQRKERFVSGHAHPGSPYVYGLVEANIELDISEEVFLVGISKSARGYCFVSVQEMMRTYSVEEGLTEEAVIAKLRAKTCMHLFLHRSLRDDPSGLARWGEWGEGGLLWAECRGKNLEWFDSDPILEVLSRAQEIYNLDPAEEFRKIVIPCIGRPAPLCVGTAIQTGILPVVGVPSLLKVLLPLRSLGLCHVYLQNLLLNPPPPKFARSIQAACRLMSSITTSIPDFTCVSAAKLVKLILTKEVNHAEFLHIRNMVEDVICMHEDEQLRSILALLLDPTLLATGLQMEQMHLVAECKLLASLLNSILAEEDNHDQASNCANVPYEFFECMESSWRGHVQKGIVEPFYIDVHNAAKGLNAAVEASFLPVVLLSRATDNTINGSSKSEIVFARDYEAIWLKLREFPSVVEGSCEEAMLKGLLVAVDCKGKRVRDGLYTTDAVEKALQRYKEAVMNASAKVYEVLRGLADRMKSSLNAIVFISVLCVIGKTVFDHVREATRRKWVIPDLLANDAGAEKELTFVDLVPYWMDNAESKAVPNLVRMHSLHLLTGPNGGGKSSLLRMIATGTILGMCGLMVPASSASIPEFDTVMLRMMSHDSPADRKSSFQMEMSEVQSILSEVTKNSLVLIDELCRGTEVQKGTAIAASVIEHLDSVGCFGIFSTHLHGILDMNLKVKNLVYISMGITDSSGVLKPTWKLQEGSSRESLAFETAMREGVPQSVIQRAEELYMSYGGVCCHKMGAQLGKRDNMSGSTNAQNGAIYAKKKEIHAFDCTRCMHERTEVINSNGLVSSGTSICTVKGIVEKFNDAVENFGLIARDKIYELQGDCKVVITRVNERQRPPPAATNRSCVYIMSRPDGKFYIGQTDNITGRIDAHRSRTGLKNVPFAYIQVANKSVASELETFLINQLPNSGVQLVNNGDKHHKHFAVHDVHTDLPF